MALQKQAVGTTETLPPTNNGALAGCEAETRCPAGRSISARPGSPTAGSAGPLIEVDLPCRPSEWHGSF
jgi:hypothetical protein